MRVQKQIIYALDLIYHLHSVETEKPGDLARTDKISESVGISQAFVRNLMSKLANADILYGYRGPSGGFRLKKTLNKIKVCDVLKALEEESKEHTDNNMLASNSPISEGYCLVLDRSFNELDQMTLEDLVKGK